MSPEANVRSDLVPLAERVGVLHAYRLAMVSLVLAAAALWPKAIEATLGDLADACAGYVLLSVTAEVVRRAARRRALAVVGALLLVDGGWLALVVARTGGPGSLLFFLVVLHVVAVTLLASYRTGLKLAVWHSLLFAGWYFVERAGFLDVGPPGVGPSSPVVAGVVALLFVALGTASFSSLNEKELRRGRKELAQLASMGAELQDLRQPSDLEQVVLARVRATFGFPRAALVLGDEGGLRHMWVTDGGGEYPDGEVPSGESPGTRHDLGGVSPDEALRWCWRHRRPHLARRLGRTVPGLSAALPGATNVIIAPMAADGRAVGALVLERGGAAQLGFSRSRLDAVMEFATHGALALRNAFLLAEVERLARKDELSGLANRRAFEETLAREVERASRTGEDLSLIMLDVDHFKRFNDTYGHQLGDEVLRGVGRALAARVRQVDLPARYGGEEFVVVLPGCGAEHAVAIAEQVRKAIAAETGELAVTASAGVATLSVSAIPLRTITSTTNTNAATELVQAADEALYESKRAGRDRVTLSPKLAPTSGTSDSEDLLGNGAKGYVATTGPPARSA